MQSTIIFFQTQVRTRNVNEFLNIIMATKSSIRNLQKCEDKLNKSTPYPKNKRIVPQKLSQVAKRRQMVPILPFPKMTKYVLTHKALF